MRSKKENFSLIAMLPLLFFCTVYPMIARVVLYDSGLEAFDWFDKTTQASDVFLYWKMVAMELTGIVMCLVLAYNLINKRQRLKGNLPIYLLSGYALLTLLSTLISEYNAYGWSGAYEQFEPVWCTLIYVLIVVYICHLANDPTQLRLLVNALAIGTLVLGVIGSLQFLGLDLVTSSVGQALVMPAKYQAQLEREAFRGLTYMTLYNPNYVGTYVSLLLPLFFSLSVCEKNIKLRILYITDCVLLYFSGLGCKSESARWGVTLVLVLMAAAWLRRVPGGWRGRLALTFLSIAAVAGINAYYAAGMPSPYKDASKAAELLGDTVQMSEHALAERQTASENLKNIETLDDRLRVTYGEDSFSISYHYEDGQFSCDVTDDSGAAVAAEQGEGGELYQFSITDPRFDGIKFRPVRYEEESIALGLQLIIDGKDWNFINELNGEPGYYYYNEFGKFDKITTAECWLFENRGSFGNGRGFIWGETLPLLRQTLIFGSGADSFTLIFPQDNYVQKYLNGYETLIISRPHNMYLQLAVQNGVLALALFLAAVAIILYRILKSFLKKEKWGEAEAEAMPLKIGVCVAVLGYLFTGLVNDAVICITPLFWCLLGIGMVLADQRIQPQHPGKTRKNRR